jgi:hypothetical protein
MGSLFARLGVFAPAVAALAAPAPTASAGALGQWCGVDGDVYEALGKEEGEEVLGGS